jgi:hypothetical protein
MNSAEYQRLKEQNWQRQLTAAEQADVEAFLLAQPSLRAEWEQEMALNRAIGQLPPVPVSSNFTSLVMMAVEQEVSRRERARLPWFKRWFAVGWLPRFALVALVVGISTFSWREYQVVHRTQLARSAVTVSDVATLPKLEWLQDFDAINRLTQAPPVDEELLTMLQ